MNTATDTWITTADVAAELRLSDRQAWELIKRLGVRCVGGARLSMATARFRRSEWEDRRDASLRAPGRRRASPVEPNKDSFVTKKEIVRQTGMSSRVIDRCVNDCTFPPPFLRLSPKIVAWKRGHFNTYCETGHWPMEAWSPAPGLPSDADGSPIREDIRPQ